MRSGAVCACSARFSAGGYQRCRWHCHGRETEGRRPCFDPLLSSTTVAAGLPMVVIWLGNEAAKWLLHSPACFAPYGVGSARRHAQRQRRAGERAALARRHALAAAAPRHQPAALPDIPGLGIGYGLCSPRWSPPRWRLPRRGWGRWCLNASNSCAPTSWSWALVIGTIALLSTRRCAVWSAGVAMAWALGACFQNESCQRLSGMDLVNNR